MTFKKVVKLQNFDFRSLPLSSPTLNERISCGMIQFVVQTNTFSRTTKTAKKRLTFCLVSLLQQGFHTRDPSQIKTGSRDSRGSLRSQKSYLSGRLLFGLLRIDTKVKYLADVFIGLMRQDKSDLSSINVIIRDEIKQSLLQFTNLNDKNKDWKIIR